jgi:hypothetical protein
MVLILFGSGFARTSMIPGFLPCPCLECGGPCPAPTSDPMGNGMTDPCRSPCHCDSCDLEVDTRCFHSLLRVLSSTVRPSLGNPEASWPPNIPFSPPQNSSTLVFSPQRIAPLLLALEQRIFGSECQFSSRRRADFKTACLSFCYFQGWQGLVNFPSASSPPLRKYERVGQGEQQPPPPP